MTIRAPAMTEALKHRWSLSHNYLAGITAGEWWQLLRENGFAVDPCYWHRAAFISLASVVNSLHAARESRRFDEKIDTVTVPPPVFVIGHWRTGTTHLHNLLSLDTDQFAFANTYQVVNPFTFLTTEAFNSRAFSWMLPDRRPMDNVRLGFDAPQEDEFAPCLMTRLSPYLGISFPRRAEHYDRYLDFRGATPQEVDTWKAGLFRFLQKLTFKFRRPLILKSPPHTARIRLLLDLFPGARFVHIHRHPFAVFQSFRHYFDTAGWYTYLQRPDTAALDTRLLSLYTTLHNAFFEQHPLIPSGHFHEIRFDDLERDPVGQIRSTYAALNIDGFDRLRPKLERELAALAGYQRNRFPELDSATRDRVAQACERSFRHWGYSV